MDNEHINFGQLLNESINTQHSVVVALHNWINCSPTDEQRYARKNASEYILLCRNKKTSKLDLSKTGINELPPFNLLNGLLHITKLDFSNNKITDIGSNAFSRFTNVTEIKLNWNGIIEIHDNAFNKLDRLKKLDLSNNRLTNIYSDEFHELHKLEWLNLYNNNLTSIYGYFDGLSRLKTLDLAYNKLTNIYSDTFTELERIEILDLSNNEIERVNSGAFHELTNLTMLKLSYNMPLTKLDDRMFDGLPNLQHLELCYNDNLERFDATSLCNNLPTLSIYLQGTPMRY